MSSGMEESRMKIWHMRLLTVSLAAALSIQGALAMESGVYQDKAPGFGGDVILTVTIRDGKIQSLITENTGGEKSEYYLKAEEALTKAILEKNGIEGVDAVSGATGTSESILAAMEGILEQAAYRGSTNASEGGTDGPTVSIKEPTLTARPHPTV